MKARSAKRNLPSLSADRARALELIPVSRETASRLNAFVDILLKWQERTNLIAPSTVNRVWTRHVADSLQLLPLAPEARVWIDLGSGGGFPGMVIACALADVRQARIHLVERNARKAAFLREAGRLLTVPTLVHSVRIEDFVGNFDEAADVVTARALAPLGDLLAYAVPLLERGAKGLFLKGQDVETELTRASRCWRIESTLFPSKTSPESRIVVVHAAERR